MCLAHLTNQLHKSNPSQYEPHAFVIDHRARPESKDESKRIVETLTKMGM